MKINPYLKVQQLYGTSKTGASSKSGKTTRTDGVEISSLGREIQIAKQAVAAAPDIREDVTAPVRKAVQNGTYDVSAESFADKLLKAAEEL